MDEGYEGRSRRPALEDLIEESLLGGYSLSITKAAIDSLVVADQVYRLGWDRIASVASMPTSKEKYNGVYEVEIERVLAGRATCLINGKWKARLASEEYDGPPNLIMKNTRLKANGTLYYEGKNLCIRVRRVTEILVHDQISSTSSFAFSVIESIAKSNSPTFGLFIISLKSSYWLWLVRINPLRLEDLPPTIGLISTAKDA